ncbi:hypothetical protein ACFO1B_00375 [Dactylosporangium siamense]|uniref:hypothetical protein n=1 Tax=Dactylosporangium siamense TaxID=685454 RepID=UPI001942BB63|nr:hypothetical protein [Dactylosporangium siamense]
MGDGGFEQLDKVQQGLVSRAQVAAAGMTRSCLRWRLHTKRWKVVLPGVFAMFTGDLHREQQLIAALLYGGPDARLTGAVAMTVHGFRSAPDERCVRIVVPCGRRVPSTGFVRVHRTKRPDPFARRVGTFRVASPERSVVEAARAAVDRRRVRAWVAEAVQVGHCTVEDLVRELRAAPRAGTAVLRLAIDEVIAGVRSVAEGDARALLAGSAVLPGLVWNPRLIGPAGVVLPTPDGWVAEADLAVEVDSREYHLSPEGWERTMRRHRQLAEAGALVLHFSPQQIREEPAAFVRSVERAYLTRLAASHRSRIDIVSAPRS